MADRFQSAHRSMGSSSQAIAIGPFAMPAPNPSPMVPGNPQGGQANPPPDTGKWFRTPHSAAEVLRHQPIKQQVVGTFWIAALIALVAAFSSTPALKKLSLDVAPIWAWVVLFCTAIQAAYVAYLITIPDWSTLWIGTVLFTALAAMYGAAMGIVFAAAPEQLAWFELTDVRRGARTWCAAHVLLLGILAYACGRMSTTWRKAEESLRKTRQSQ